MDQDYAQSREVIMPAEHKPQLSTDQVAAWLAGYHGGDVADLAPLSGGFWSAAYAYRVGGDAFVLRLGDRGDWYAIDRAAMRFAAPDLPVPEIIDIGTALGRSFAISRRHYGRFIETIPAAESDAVAGALTTLLSALRAAPTQPGDPVRWYDPEPAPGLTWHAWLRSGLVDNSDNPATGWRAKLAADPRLDRVFKACASRIETLLPACPERRDLVHGDLLHQNVLVSEDARRVTAIFSWKCSALGDFLFDVAWCTFWGDWHPVIAHADLWRRTLAAPDLRPADLLDAPARHHCYELQIAASHLGWNAWTGNDAELVQIGRRDGAPARTGSFAHLTCTQCPASRTSLAAGAQDGCRRRQVCVLDWHRRLTVRRRSVVPAILTNRCRPASIPPRMKAQVALNERVSGQ